MQHKEVLLKADGTPAPAIRLKTQQELAFMRESGRIAALVRDEVARAVAPGVTTAELSDYAAELMKKFGAESAFLGHNGYPAAICVSVNDEVVHGVPGSRRIELGDLVSIDVGVRWEGYIGDTATTVMAGVSDPVAIKLVKTTEAALMAGIRAARAGRRLSDISCAIETVARAAGFSVVRRYVGHGVGRELHEEPPIPNFGPGGRGPKLRCGMTLAPEPMVCAGSGAVEAGEDGWTVRTVDGSLAAHFEHTIAIGEGEAEILTL